MKKFHWPAKPEKDGDSSQTDAHKDDPTHLQEELNIQLSKVRVWIGDHRKTFGIEMKKEIPAKNREDDTTFELNVDIESTSTRRGDLHAKSMVRAFVSTEDALAGEALAVFEEQLAKTTRDTLLDYDINGDLRKWAENH